LQLARNVAVSARMAAAARKRCNIGKRQSLTLGNVGGVARIWCGRGTKL